MRLIDADVFAAEMKKRQDEAGKWLRAAKDHETATRADAVLSFLCEVKLTLDKMPTVDAVPVCRCKDCKHRPKKPDDYNPITTDGFVLEFPDDECPCNCADGWYSWYPPDDFFCAKGKRKGGDE